MIVVVWFPATIIGNSFVVGALASSLVLSSCKSKRMVVWSIVPSTARVREFFYPKTLLANREGM